MKERIVIETDGLIVGALVRVNGGFVFFASDPDLRVLEGALFSRAEIASLVQAKKAAGSDFELPWDGVSNDRNSENVVRLCDRRGPTNADPEPPDAA